MSDLKISQLSAISALDEDDILLIIEDGTAKKVTTAQLRAALTGELAYVEFTSPVTISATTEGASNTIVTAGAITYDGGAVWVEFFSPKVVPNSANGSVVRVILTLDGTSQGWIIEAQKDGSASSDRGTTMGYARRKLTPSAGSHTILAAGWRVTGDGTVQAGAGGSGAYTPGYIRITRA